jgi:ribonuclease Z
LSLVLCSTGVANAQEEGDDLKALEARVAARWDFEAERERTLLDKERFTVFLAGTGAPTKRDRLMAGTAVFANGKFFLFDAGDGVVEKTEHMGLPLREIDAVFVTHFHSDHIDDLGAVIQRSYILGRRTFLPVFGGEGIEEIVDGIEKIYAGDFSYRTGHHGQRYMPSNLANAFKGMTIRFDGMDHGEGHGLGHGIGHDHAPDDGHIVFAQDGVIVTAFTVTHEPIRPALGYRVDFNGKSVVISGDTSETPNLHQFSKGADVLVSEVMNMKVEKQMEKIHRDLGHGARAKIFHDIRNYHLGTDEVGKLAAKAGVKTLILTHLVPSTDDDAYMNRVFRDEVAEHYKGQIIVGKDGMEFVLP